jgi:16S rRNA (cytosine1402-N4)-methyltransferase
VQEENAGHIPVLAEALVQTIALDREAVAVDATLGHGGHSLLLGRQLGPAGVLIGFDVDEKCIRKAGAVLEGLACRVILIKDNFARMEAHLSRLGIPRVDLILADLGWCTAQMEDPERGLSFQKNMPLDMRLDNRLKTNAADIVNKYSEKDLADLIYEFGEEHASRKIAKAIIEYRRDRTIKTTAELARLVCRALRRQPGSGRLHPATRTFQALRIAVNDELENLRILLQIAPQLLKSGGLLAVISFHSLEDRLVKTSFRENKTSGIYEILTKKPIVASDLEVRANPRSRSAKLRIVRRTGLT